MWSGFALVAFVVIHTETLQRQMLQKDNGQNLDTHNITNLCCHVCFRIRRFIKYAKEFPD